jgi:hypothetical protein
LQACLKVLAALLRTLPEFKLSTPQLRALVAWAFTDLSVDATARAPLFSLLKAILDRKAVQVLEVYDVMTRVQVRTLVLLLCDTKDLVKCKCRARSVSATAMLTSSCCCTACTVHNCKRAARANGL